MTDAKMAPEKRGAAEQLPLAFEHGSATGRDDLLVSERMAAAVSIVDAWPNWPSPVVILTGPEGSGKSHLAQIFRDISGASDIILETGKGASEAAAAGPVLFEDADRAGFDQELGEDRAAGGAERAPHAEWLALYSDLLRRRHAHLIPWLQGARSGVMTLAAPGTLRITWPLGSGHRWHLLAQLASHESPAGLATELPGALVYRSHPVAARLAPWSVQIAIEAP